jgi:sulfoxide reductase catalytic subunit YedY
MSHISIKPDWWISEKKVTPESVYNNRRHFLKQMGFTGMGILGGLSMSKSLGAEADIKKATFPYKRNPDFSPEWKLTDQNIVESYNNFYEFTTTKSRVRQMVDRFVIDPWKVEISGLVENPKTMDMGEIYKAFNMEERVYRFRCVEAWSMVVPWTGFQLSELIKLVKPKPEAKFVKFTTFNRPDQAPGMRFDGYPWPYVEGLTMEEAQHPLTLLSTGVYGKALPKQNGAPIRLVVPWKYGYKSIKSIEKIEFTAEQPKTFWKALSPEEYPFESNVDPDVPHPRWSQAYERVVDTGLRRRTNPFNGYGNSLSNLY